MSAGMSTAPAVTLREITAATVRSIIALNVSPAQQRFVAPNAVSLAEALFSPIAWYRAIYAGEQPAGFVMLADETLQDPVPADPSAFVWRFMIDASLQRHGIGRAAMLAVIQHVREKQRFSKLELSYVPGEGSPEPFYRSLGFEPTGRVEHDEVVLAYVFRGADA